jgi:hypothetical protein
MSSFNWLRYYNQINNIPNPAVRAAALNVLDLAKATDCRDLSRLATGQPTWNEATSTIEDVATFEIDAWTMAVWDRACCPIDRREQRPLT